MILNILKYPNPLLKEKSEKVPEITLEVRKFAEDMKETMIKSKGIGLAAPQVGQLKRIIVVQSDFGPKALINPEITRASKETEIMEEGCLCAPEIFLDVKRAKSVDVKYTDENGREIKESAEGLPARILQHEIDHLNGVLFLDRIGFWEKWKLLMKLKKRKKSNAD